QWRAAFARDVRDAECRIKTNAEKFLQDSREQYRITIIEEIIQTTFGAVAGEIFIIQAATKNPPEVFSANGFLVWLFAKRGCSQTLQRYIIRRDVFGQRKLVLTFCVNCFLPEMRACAW